jgi:predicted Zn-ribbon and HTH transcriptional regulator
MEDDSVRDYRLPQAEPVSRLGPSGFDPARCGMCGRSVRKWVSWNAYKGCPTCKERVNGNG